MTRPRSRRTPGTRCGSRGSPSSAATWPGFPEGGWEHLGFPPLYPILAKAVAVPLGGNTELALLLVGNAAHIVLLASLYRWSLLVLGDPADDPAARRATRFWCS